MQLITVNDSELTVDKTLFQDLLGALPKVHQLPEHAKTVELLLTDDQRVQTLNKQYRGKDKTTDVLSFPLGGENFGQIIISVPQAERQAKDLGQSLQEELRFLFAHGLLHICGYDHKEPEEEAIMLQKTYQLLGRKAS